MRTHIHLAMLHSQACFGAGSLRSLHLPGWQGGGACARAAAEPCVRCAPCKRLIKAGSGAQVESRKRGRHPASFLPPQTPHVLGMPCCAPPSPHRERPGRLLLLCSALRVSIEHLLANLDASTSPIHPAPVRWTSCTCGEPTNSRKGAACARLAGRSRAEGSPGPP